MHSVVIFYSAAPHRIFDSKAILIYCHIVVNLNHFRLLRVVGKGAFGKVRIVERKDTGLTFALKYIRKDEGTLLSPANFVRREN